MFLYVGHLYFWSTDAYLQYQYIINHNTCSFEDSVDQVNAQNATSFALPVSVSKTLSLDFA